MSERKAPPRAPTYDDAVIADLAERVYRAELGPKDAASMVEKDQDDGVQLRNAPSHTRRVPFLAADNGARP